MAERQNTKNAVPSNAMADLNDNTISFDEFMNSSSSTTDRFGNAYKSRKQILAELEKEITANKNKGFVKVSGDTMNGNFIIEKDKPAFKMTNNAPVTPLNFLTSMDAAAIRWTITGDDGDKQRWGYNFSAKTFSFTCNDVVLNGKSLLKAGDYGIGGQVINYGASSYDIDQFTTPTQFGWYNQGAKGSLPSINSGFLLNFNIINQNIMQIASDYITQKLYFRHSRAGEWKDWQELITIANVSSYQGLGYDQTWQDMKESRQLGVAYTNTTGKPIQIIMSVAHSSKDPVVRLYFTIDGIEINASAGHNFGWDYGSASVSIIVPSGSSYSAKSTNARISNWIELK